MALQRALSTYPPFFNYCFDHLTPNQTFNDLVPPSTFELQEYLNSNHLDWIDCRCTDIGDSTVFAAYTPLSDSWNLPNTKVEISQTHQLFAFLLSPKYGSYPTSPWRPIQAPLLRSTTYLPLYPPPTLDPYSRV